MTEPKKPTQAVKSDIHAIDPDPYLALGENQFVPYFQPLITLRTGQLAGFEALARWQHPTLGLLTPSSFIGIAEQDGWIDELTRQVLPKALVAASKIPDPLTLAFNISPTQLRDRGLPKQIRRMAMDADFPLSRLILEITESALVDDVESAAAIVADLKSMGCRLALDDFGTGYSSLRHLQSLPFDKLKVDRSFISSMLEQRDSRKIVAAVIGLGRNLGLTTFAEGIETQEQAEIILGLGCDIGQGFLYGRPIPAEELAASVSTHGKDITINELSAWKRIPATNLDVSPAQRLAQLQAIHDGPRSAWRLLISSFAM
jgi:EAL domain-containing protein (putative c-di-GMP-specific phosphodiesterase class I)